MRRSVTAALAAAFGILFLPLALPLVTWKIFPFGDFSAFQVPMRFIYREALRAGDSFLWTPAIGSGLYLHAEGQVGMAHPAHLLMYRLLPLTLAINLEMLGAFAGATAGLWLLFRRLGIRGDAAFGGALSFAFGGYMLPHLNHLTPIVVAAHIPWVVLAADYLLRGSGKTAALGFAAAALTIGSQVLIGYPQVVWMTAVILGWFVVYRMATGTPLSRIAILAIALLLGLAIGGAQLLPTFDATRESFRAATTFAFRMSSSLHPLNLVQLFSPYALQGGVYIPAADESFAHELTLYDGALATFSIVWVVARWRSLPRRDLAAAFLGLAAIGLVIALGRYGGLYPLLARLPILSSFRVSSRHIAIVQFGFAGLVALTLQDLLDRPAGAPWPRWPLVVPVTISAIITAIAVLGGSGLSAYGVPAGSVLVTIAGLGFAVATAACIALAARGSNAAIAAVIVVAAADLACSGLRFAYAERPIPIRGVSPLMGYPTGATAGDLVHPLNAPIEMNRFVMRGLRSQLAYVGLVRSARLDSEAAITQRIAGVKWAWAPTGWMLLDKTMPRARFVTEWRVSGDMLSDVKTIDIARVALVDASPGAATGEPGEARIATERPGRFRIDTRADSEQLLILTERFHDGWAAEVDGTPVPTRRVYGDYLGCLVPGGAHTVSFVFAPQSWRTGLWLSVIGLGLSVLGAVIVARVR